MTSLTLRYLLVASKCLPFHGRSLDERPLGGIETAVIRFAEGLAKWGNDVIVCTPHSNPKNDALGLIQYLPLEHVNNIQRADVLIAVRDWLPAITHLPGTLRYFWTGDAYDQLPSFGLGDKRVWSKLTALLFTSQWHGDTMCAAAGIPKEKLQILPNGVHIPFFHGTEKRNLNRLIYSSTPYRGLAHVPRLFRRVKQVVTDAEIYIFSGYKVYEDGISNAISRHQLAEYEKMKLECKNTSGIIFSDNISQAQLAREFMKSAILFYPNTFAETFCITAAEALAAGCIPVTSNLGGLPSTVGSEGVLVEGVPGTEEYDNEFVARVIELLTNPDKLEVFSQLARRQAFERFNYSKIAKDFHQSIVNRLVGHPTDKN